MYWLDITLITRRQLGATMVQTSDHKSFQAITAAEAAGIARRKTDEKYIQEERIVQNVQELRRKILMSIKESAIRGEFSISIGSAAGSPYWGMCEPEARERILNELRQSPYLYQIVISSNDIYDISIEWHPQ
jgi:hypothetical protein